MIKKLNLSTDTKKDLLSVSRTISSHFINVETIDDTCTWWSVDKSKSCEIIQSGSYEYDNLIFKNVTVGGFDFLESKIENLPTFFQKYKFYEFMGAALEHNFQTHKHIYAAPNNESLSCYSVVVFNDAGSFNIVTPINYVDPEPKFDLPNITMFARLPNDVQRNIYSIEVEPDDIYIFNTWTWHHFITENKPQTNVFYVKALTEEVEAKKYIEYIESL